MRPQPWRPLGSLIDHYPAVHDGISIGRANGPLGGRLHRGERLRWFTRGAFWGGTPQSIIGYGTIVNWFLIGLARQKQSLSLIDLAVMAEWVRHAARWVPHS